MWNPFSHLLDLSHGFRMMTTFRVTFNWSANCYWVWVSSSSNNACNSLSFRWFSTFFVSHVKIATFEFFKPPKALWFTKSMLTVSFDKHSLRFCSSFLQMYIITENQCCLQIIVSKHKIRRYVQRYFKLYCCMKFVLLWVENLCQMSEQGNGINDGNYIDSYDYLLINSGFIFTYLIYERLIIIILFPNYNHYNQTFHHVRYHLVFPLQSMVINTQPGSTILF